MLVGLFLTSGTSAFAHGEYHQRVMELKQQLAADPSSTTLHRKLAATYAGHEEWMLCLKEIGTVERASGQSPDTQYLRGLAYAGLNHRERALTAFNASLSLRPDQATVLTDRGKLKMKSRDSQGAIDDLARASELDPTTESFLNVTKAWLAAGKQPEALRALDRGIALGGPHPELLETALEIEVKAGDWNAALKRVESLSALAPRPEPWMARRARLLAQAGRAELATDAWRDLRDHLLGLPNLERGTPLLSSLLAESRAALGERIPSPAVAPPALSSSPTISSR